MTNEEIFEKVKKVVIEQLGVEADKVKNETIFADDLGMDSLDVVEFIMALEETFDIEIPDEDAEKMKTIEDTVNYISSKK